MGSDHPPKLCSEFCAFTVSPRRASKKYVESYTQIAKLETSHFGIGYNSLTYAIHFIIPSAWKFWPPPPPKKKASSYDHILNMSWNTDVIFYIDETYVGPYWETPSDSNIQVGLKVSDWKFQPTFTSKWKTGREILTYGKCKCNNDLSLYNCGEITNNSIRPLTTRKSETHKSVLLLKKFVRYFFFFSVSLRTNNLRSNLAQKCTAR